MKFFDSHVHLDMEPLSAEIPRVVERANAAGVSGMINIGSSLRGSKASVEIASSYPNIWATVGLHPHEAETLLDAESKFEELDNMAKIDEVVAIGEIGLDYFNFETGKEVSDSLKEKQKELFVRQLDIASNVGKPVVIHIRDAWEDAYKIVSSFKFQVSKPGVIHCFTGDAEIAKKFTELGFFLGFTGFVTFEQAKFEHIREAARVTPIDKILIETDCPFLAPEPFRGKPNEPAFVVEVAKKIAALKEIDLGEVARLTYKNAADLFQLSK